MRKCAFCGGTAWGLVRYQALTLHGYIYFDKKRCKERGSETAISKLASSRDKYMTLPAYPVLLGMPLLASSFFER